ncbi:MULTISPECIES: DUF3150 domain-containing protein [Xanthomonas]|uniref:DUF3150 domain-containing protein n=10 Tax=Xanthomonas TaxID=338 RepID=A0A6V7FJ90_9XANT|nr:MULTISPECIES: DUF3150 domain-containing protein [Xanthomonas]MEB1846256.1 DUF3150 domain-containing protein [Xanthomonas campestris pv. campestris]APO97695.1 hypothetical protein BJD13_00435 [Xanthomonas perforans]APP78189.1 hypothetical protein BJD12_22930 [Xanthomonas vesicatoria ATCC 35937]APP82660.1 hypothetical protein BJD10_23545 [Xanthomonas hortorum pv. gardneri]APP87190.1 hypothetical protein BI317_24260 [Xanthomonas hortorum pv. gardneri]
MTISIKDSPISKLVMFSPQVSIWSGTLKIDRDLDYKDIASTLPPQQFASDGRKNLVDQKYLAGPRKLRKRLERLLKTEGFSLIGDCVAVNEDRAVTVLNELPKLEAEFIAEVDSFIAFLQSAYMEQVDKAPVEWKELLMKGRLTADEVRKRFAFKVGVFKITAPAENDADPINAHFANTIMVNATPRLMEDVAAEARDIFFNSFMVPVEPSNPKGKRRFKDSVTQATVKQVTRLVEKLSDYSFLDARVYPTVTSLRVILSSLPFTGPLNAQQTSTCSTVLRQLMDPETTLGIGEAFAANPNAPQLPTTPAQPTLFAGSTTAQPATYSDIPSVEPAVMVANQSLSQSRRQLFSQNI